MYEILEKFWKSFDKIMRNIKKISIKLNGNFLKILRILKNYKKEICKDFEKFWKILENI